MSTASLSSVSREKLTIAPSLSKEWNIYNPTNISLAILGREGVTAILNPTPSHSLDRSKIYIQIKYSGRPGSNITIPSDKINNIIDCGNGYKVTYIHDVKEITATSDGLYFKELDLVIGTLGKDLKFPRNYDGGEVYGDHNNSTHQFHLNSGENRTTDYTYVELFGEPVKVKVENTKEPNGLYIHSTDEGITLSRMIRREVVSDPEKEILCELINNDTKSKFEYNPKYLDSSIVSNHIAVLTNIVKSISSVVDAEIEEKYKFRDRVRKDNVEETKTSRTIGTEGTKSIGESLKTISTLINLTKDLMAKN